MATVQMWARVCCSRAGGRAYTSSAMSATVVGVALSASLRGRERRRESRRHDFAASDDGISRLLPQCIRERGSGVDLSV
eukprot:443642-Prymnesium_polylepis.1